MTETNDIQKYIPNPDVLAKEIRETGNVWKGFEYTKLVQGIAESLDSSLDIILPAIESVFDETPEKLPPEYRGMDFYESTIKSTNLSPDTIHRHTKVGRMLEVAPDGVRGAIEAMNFKSKIQIAHAVEDGYDLDRVNGGGRTGWDKLADAYYPQEVALTLHEIKGTEPRSQFCKFEVDDEGNLWARTARGSYKIFEKVSYDNQESAEIAEWAAGKAKRKLDVTPKIRRG